MQSIQNINYVELVKHIVLQHVDSTSFKVFLFGSRACGNSKKFSDIDVGILGNKPFSTITKFEIEQAIEDSIVPFKVDIIDFFNANSTFKTEALKQIVEWN